MCGGAGLLPRTHLLQRLVDVLGAGERCNTLYTIGAALQMGDRAVGTKLTAWPALQLHCAIASESLCLAGPLGRQLDRFAPLRLQLRSHDAVAVERLLALQVMRRRRRLLDGGDRL